MTKRGSKSGVLFLAGWMIGILVLCCSIASAATLSMSWNANTEADLAGYQVYIDQAAPVDVGLVTAYQVEITPSEGQTYAVQVTAYDLTGNESEKSDVATCVYDTPPAAPTGLKVWFAQIIAWIMGAFHVG
jgi:hypothetical protein